MPVLHPFNPKRRNPVWGFVRPSTTGALVSAVVASLPKSCNKSLLRVVEKIPGGSNVPERLYLALLGFIVGYGLFKGCDWIRHRLLKSLLGYQGWVVNPRSKTTKVKFNT